MQSPAPNEQTEAEARFWDQQYAHAGDRGVLAGACAPDLNEREAHFRHLLARSSAERVLSIGGGIDLPAISMAARGARVVTVDVSAVACRRTEELARAKPLRGSLQVICAPFEEVTYERTFDLVVARSALHHMHFDLAVSGVHRALVPGGELLAQEPICLSPTIAFLQRSFPYHPQEAASPFEIKLGKCELRLLQATFSCVQLMPFELLARPWFVFHAQERGHGRLVDRLRRLDRWLTAGVPPLVRFCHYAVISARK